MSTDVSPATWLLRMSQDPRFRSFMEARSVNRNVASRFVAGESVSSALDATGELLARGRFVTVGHLSSDPLDQAEARSRRKRLRKVLRRLGQAELATGGRVEVAVRPGALGARLPGVGMEVALENARVVAESAQLVGARVLVESEPGLPAEETLALTDALRADFPDTGVELWSVRRRTEADVRERIEAGCRVRLSHGGDDARGGCEPVHGSKETDLAYVRSLAELMRSAVPFSVSARDRRVVDITEAMVAAGEREAGSFEYHVRMGTRPIAEATIADRGDRMRVFVPFGEEWYPYLMARMVDQPGQLVGLCRPMRPTRKR